MSMLESLGESLSQILGVGVEAGNIGVIQAALRTAVVYVVSLVLVRLGNKRFMAQASAFDLIVAIMLGSVMSRAINSSAPLVPTIVAGALLILVHWLFSYLAVRTDWFGMLVKGHSVTLIKDGETREEGLRQSGITGTDLSEAARLQGVTDLSQVEQAHLERSGKISFIKQERGPRVLEVEVKDGVQTVRVALE